MKDRFGHERGACNNCPTCQEYVAPDGDGVRCEQCECKPVDHENLSRPVHSRGQPDSRASNSPVSSDASKCRYPGCFKSVDFDPNSGRECYFCYAHSDSTEIDSSPENLPQSQLPGDFPLSIQHVDQVVPAAPLPLLPTPQIASTTCALPECNNPRYVDPNTGKVHECCSYTHAMEHQRRLNIQQSSSVVKGITHCLLPGCDNLVWPFCNYCGRTHADQGIQMGLTPPQPQVLSPTAVGTKGPSICIIPNCSQPKYVEPDGKVHPYCGKNHAILGQQLGIFPTVDKEEDQCELEGCTRPKMTEGTRVHDYCCKSHADKDAPNRAARILTKKEDVLKWLGQFKSLKIVRLEENDAAKPPNGRLFKQFRDKMLSLPQHHRKTCLAFHGTSAQNVTSICQNGYDPGMRGRHGQAHGPGEYFATTPETSMGYCDSGKKMLLNELLLGQQGVHHTQSGGIIVMKDPVHDLPRFIITFQ